MGSERWPVGVGALDGRSRLGSTHDHGVAGWPLGDGGRHSDVVMENLIGDDLDRLPEIALDPKASLHLYGKPDIRPGRKMGHVNRVTSTR